ARANGRLLCPLLLELVVELVLVRVDDRGLAPDLVAREQQHDQAEGDEHLARAAADRAYDRAERGSRVLGVHAPVPFLGADRAHRYDGDALGHLRCGLRRYSGGGFDRPGGLVGGRLRWKFLDDRGGVRVGITDFRRRLAELWNIGGFGGVWGDFRDY